jgi:hypothetical protein
MTSTLGCCGVSDDNPSAGDEGAGLSGSDVDGDCAVFGCEE